VVYARSSKVMAAPRFVLELILSDHPSDCMTCERTGSWDMQNLGYEYGIKQTPYVEERHQSTRRIPAATARPMAAGLASAPGAAAWRPKSRAPNAPNLAWF